MRVFEEDFEKSRYNNLFLGTSLRDISNNYVKGEKKTIKRVKKFGKIIKFYLNYLSRLFIVLSPILFPKFSFYFNFNNYSDIFLKTHGNTEIYHPVDLGVN